MEPSARAVAATRAMKRRRWDIARIKPRRLPRSPAHGQRLRPGATFVTLCQGLGKTPHGARQGPQNRLCYISFWSTMTQAAARTDKILVVDDDARIRDLLRRYLTQEGFEGILAEDGKALNRLLLRDTVDLIVLDLMMPGEDGLSICRRLRAANDRTPIVMLTAKGEDVDRIVGLEVGADDYLGKPFNPRELLARIHAVLRRR